MVPKNKKLLLVEDDEAIREMYRLKFALQNIDIAIAENGREARKLALKIKPELILLDIKIPEYIGDEILYKLRRYDWAANMRVIILTNISRDEAPDGLERLGFDRYIIKAHFTP